MSYDNACKYLAEKYPADFVRWLLQTEPEKLRILKTELNLEPIYADSLLLLRMGRQILHLEFQTKPQSKPPLPLRVLDYSVRLKRKYRCSVVQIMNQTIITEINLENLLKEAKQETFLMIENGIDISDNSIITP